MHYLHDYSTFESTAELNKAVYEHIRRNTHELNETSRKALKMISRYAVKYAGASHLKASTLAELIGKSEKTARRTIAKLRELGIIEKYTTTRKINGGYGANIIVILPLDDQSITSSREVAETPTESKSDEANFNPEPSYFNKQLTSTKEIDTASVPSSALRSALPSAIYNAMTPFCNADEIYRYYGLLLQAKRRTCPSTLIENDPTPYVDAFNAVMLKVKHGKVNDVERYLYVAFASAASEVDRRANDDGEESILAYNWIA